MTKYDFWIEWWERVAGLKCVSGETKLTYRCRRNNITETTGRSSLQIVGRGRRFSGPSPVQLEAPRTSVMCRIVSNVGADSWAQWEVGRNCDTTGEASRKLVQLQLQFFNAVSLSYLDASWLQWRSVKSTARLCQSLNLTCFSNQ